MSFISFDLNWFWTRLRYPKFITLFLTFIIAYVLFTGSHFGPVRAFILSLGLLGAFFAGIFYSYGFTAAPSTALFLIIALHENIWLAGLLGGLGALVGDLIIFKFIRSSFADEIDRIAQERITKLISQHTPKFIKKYLIPIIGCIVIASPLPDEIGVTLLALSTISTRMFVIASYILNTIGILIILYIGTTI